MKTVFTPEQRSTPEYAEHVRWMSNVWRLNDERNKRDARHIRLQQEQAETDKVLRAWFIASE